MVAFIVPDSIGLLICGFADVLAFIRGRANDAKSCLCQYSSVIHLGFRGGGRLLDLLLLGFPHRLSGEPFMSCFAMEEIDELDVHEPEERDTEAETD